MHLSQEIQSFVEHFNIRVVPNDRNYWLFRTYGGKYFETFCNNNYIGIGWNLIDSESELRLEHDKLKELVSELYPNIKSPGGVASQILRFANDIKCGDIVLVPSASSSLISFCEVTDDKVYFANDHDISLLTIANDEDNNQPEILFKRRKIKVIKTLSKYQLDPYLYPLFRSNHTITDANDYSPFIERLLDNLYIKGDKIHTVINVGKKTEISAVDLINGINIVMNATDFINDLLPLIQVRANVSEEFNNFMST